MRPFLAAAAALSVAAALSPLVLRALRGRVVDVPGARSSHDTPTPRGGGLVIVAGTVAGLALLAEWPQVLAGALAAALLLGGIGLVEDVRGIPVWPRLGLQLVVVAAVLPLLLADWSGAVWWQVTFGAACLLWIVGFTNAFNFMDGINGIGGAQLVVAGAAFAAAGALADEPLLRNLGAITAAAALGFLPWNFPQARFFMGDVGSYFSGGWLAAVAIVGIRLGVAPAAVLAPLAIFGGDAALTLIRRVRRGEVWYRPHRTHVYQQMVAAGWSHARTTAYYALLAATGSAAGLLAVLNAAGTVAAIVVVLGVMVAYALTPDRVGGSRRS